jgi:hypothetical protein
MMAKREHLKHIVEATRRTRVAGDADVIVCGAGPAGIAAALASARNGAKTRLIEVHGCLGGVWTAGLLSWLFEMEQPGIAREITRELDRRGARRGGSRAMYAYDVEAMKLLLEDLCAAAKVEVQLHTRLVATAKDQRRLRAIVTESKSGREAWSARCFIDATGDGDLAAMSGCGFSIGRPGSGECQPMTYMALVSVGNAKAVSPCISFWGGAENRSFWSHLAATKKFAAELRRAGVQPSYAVPTLFQAQGNLLALMVNHEYGVSAIDARQVTAATLRGRAEVNRVVNALRRLGGVWKELQLIATCEQIGVREGRRIHGRYVVTQNDLIAGSRHADAVCRVTSAIDVHCTNPAKGKGQETPPVRTKPYDIPIRSLIARDLENLLLAGRCISGDFIAHSSYRVTGVAAATGQAAGVTAALSARLRKLPNDIPWSRIEGALRKTIWVER